MNKQEFLNSLSDALQGIPENERAKTLEYYTEIIDDAIEEGEEENTVIARLDSPSAIRAKIIDEIPLRKFVSADMKNKDLSVVAIILLVISSPLWLPLLFCALLIILGIYVTIWSVIVSLFSIFASLAVSALALLISIPFLSYSLPKAMLVFGTSLVCTGLSVFVLYLSLWCSKKMIKLTISLIRKIKSGFIRKGSEL